MYGSHEILRFIGFSQISMIPGARQTAEGWWVMKQDINRSKAIEDIYHDIAWEPDMLAFAYKGIVIGKTIVDIGANIGDTAVPFLKFSGGPVVAYEPDP